MNDDEFGKEKRQRVGAFKIGLLNALQMSDEDKMLTSVLELVEAFTKKHIHAATAEAFEIIDVPYTFFHIYGERGQHSLAVVPGSGMVNPRAVDAVIGEWEVFNQPAVVEIDGRTFIATTKAIELPEVFELGKWETKAFQERAAKIEELAKRGRIAAERLGLVKPPPEAA